MERTTYLVPINQYDIDLHSEGMNSSLWTVLCNCGWAVMIAHFRDVYLWPGMWLKSFVLYFYWRDYDRADEDVSVRLRVAPQPSGAHARSRGSSQVYGGKLQLQPWLLTTWASSTQPPASSHRCGVPVNSCSCARLLTQHKPRAESDRFFFRTLPPICLLRSNLLIKAQW